jgi:hypothetical protein
MKGWDKILGHRHHVHIINSALRFYPLFPCFLIIRNLTKHLKINNMRFMNLMMIYYFIQVQGSKRGYLTKDDYFLNRKKLL